MTIIVEQKTTAEKPQFNHSNTTETFNFDTNASKEFETRFS